MKDIRQGLLDSTDIPIHAAGNKQSLTVHDGQYICEVIQKTHALRLALVKYKAYDKLDFLKGKQRRMQHRSQVNRKHEFRGTKVMLKFP